jgi:signal transduction histidine kinase
MAMMVRGIWLVTAAIALTLHLVAMQSLGRALSADQATAITNQGLTVEFYVGWLALMALAIALVFAAAAGLLIWRRPDERAAVFAAFALLLFGTVTFSGFGAAPLTDYPALLFIYKVLDVFGRVSFTTFVFVFPDGRFVPRWIRWLAGAWIAVQVPAPFADTALIRPLMPVVDALTGPLFIIGLIAAAASQVYRYRHVSTAVQRRQTRWTAIGFAAALGLYLVSIGVQLLVPTAREPLPTLFIATLEDAAIALIPISIAIALLRHGLFDVEVFIGRALVYAVLTACTVVVFVLVVGSLGLLFRTQDNLLISLLGTGAVAVMFQPLRERLQRGVNRLLYGRRDEPYAVLSDLGRRLDSSDDRAHLLPVMVETVAAALKAPYVALRLPGEDADLAEAASVGVLDGAAEQLPLIHRGQRLGALAVGRRGGTEPFDAADRRLLDDLARQAAAALYSMQLNTELQQSREHLVTAREEERRRLRRDLHDGLGPTLAALGLKIETARRKLGQNSGADAVLADLSARTEEAVADIRRLVYALRPPALDDLGLIGALQQVVAPAESSLHVAIETPDESLPPLSAATEVAAYRIVQEAFTNIVRHARATQCIICLQVSDAALELSVQDNGVGISDSVRRGVGLASMRERADELGGSFRITPIAGGGTCVEARLPLLHVESAV